MPASSSKDPYLLKVFTGSFWPFGGLFPPPFFLGLLVVLELERDAAGFINSAACTHPGSKSGAWGKHWVQHQETQNSCPLSTQTRTVPGRRSNPALTSRRKPGYRSIPIRDRQKQVQQNGQSALGVRRNPGKICQTDHRFNQFFSCWPRRQIIQLQ